MSSLAGDLSSRSYARRQWNSSADSADQVGSIIVTGGRACIGHGPWQVPRLHQPRVVHDASPVGLQIDLGRNDAIDLQQAVPDSIDTVRAAHPHYVQQGHGLLLSLFDGRRLVQG